MAGSIRGHGDVGQPFGPEPAGKRDQFVDLRAAGVRHSGRSNGLDAASGAQRFVEYSEPRAPVLEGRRKVNELQPEAQVRLVGAVPLQGLAIVDAREGHLLDRPIRHDRAADFDDHGLDEVHDPLLGHETHLEVQLREFQLPVAAQVLVAKAAGNLEVAVHAGYHQQLLELLRALRQGVDRAGLQAAGDDEVASAFGRGLEQDRRLDLDEAGPVVGLANRAHQLRSQQ